MAARPVGAAAGGHPGLAAGGPSLAQLADADLRRWKRVGYLILLVAVGGFLLWATFVPLSSAVVAQGLVKVDSSRKRVQHLEGGVVKEILVRDGARVKAGSVVIRLDETRAGASHGVMQSAYDTAIAHRARLEAERDGSPVIHFPAEMTKRAGDPKMIEIMRTQNEMFRTRRTSLAGQLDILDRQIEHLRKQIEGLAAQQRAKEEQLRLLREELAGLQNLAEKGMVERTKLRNLERAIADLDGERARHASDIAASRASIDEKELEKFQIRKRFQEEVAADLRKNQSEVFDYLERSTATRHTLEQTEIRAPVDGTVVDLKVHTAGGVINPGELLMEIVPDRDRLVIEGKVRPEDIDRIAVGFPTGVKISAFNQRTTPELNGNLIYVSADAITDEKTGFMFFLIRIEVPESEMKRLGDNVIQPGMIANLFVRTGERTFLQYLMHPLVDSFDKAWRER